jgi:septal ring factor EnvC (AmiA/AmiB activator)
MGVWKGARRFTVEFQPMTPEEMERAMQFVLRQQAQFAADFEKLTVKTDRFADGLIGLTGVVGRLAEGQERTDQQLRAAAEQVRENDARLSQADAELREYIRTVEAHLNILIEMFERHLRESHGERPS